MKDNIKIDSNKLNEYVSKLKEDDDKIIKIFDNIKRVSSSMTDYWQTDTSSEVMAKFEQIYKEFENIKESNKKYISFLESIVTVDYSDTDDSLSKIIDNNI